MIHEMSHISVGRIVLIKEGAGTVTAFNKITNQLTVNTLHGVIYCQYEDLKEVTPFRLKIKRPSASKIWTR